MPSGTLPGSVSSELRVVVAMNPVYPGVIAAVLYVVGAFRQIDAVTRAKTASPRDVLLFVTVGVCAHAVAAFLVMSRPDGIDFGLLAMGSLVTLVLTAFVLVASTFQPVENLLMLTTPLAAVTVVASVMFPDRTIAHAIARDLLAHVFLSILAYTMLALAACQAIALALQERLIKGHRALSVIRVLPPIQTMESLLFQQIWVGFVLLTLSLGSGALFLPDAFSGPHAVLSSASWIIFLLLLIGRHAFGWRGATATRWTLTGFALLLVAYFGSKFVLQILLGRG